METRPPGAIALRLLSRRRCSPLPPFKLAQVLWPHGGTHLEVGPLPTLEDAQIACDALTGSLSSKKWVGIGFGKGAGSMSIQINAC